MPDRTQLRETTARLRAEEDRLAKLEQAQDRAHQQLFQAERDLSSAKGAYQKALQLAPRRLAYAYVDEGLFNDDPSPEAKADVDRGTAEVEQLEKVEAALLGEIARVQGVLRRLRVEQSASLALVISSSEEFRTFLQHHSDAWHRLRTIKETLRLVVSGLNGQATQEMIDTISTTEPLEIRVGYGVDQMIVGAWADTLLALQSDPDAPLPQL